MGVRGGSQGCRLLVATLTVFLTTESFAGGADIAFYVCAPARLIALSPSVHDSQLHCMSGAVAGRNPRIGAQTSTPCLRQPALIPPEVRSVFTLTICPSRRLPKSPYVTTM